jgi:drug/metabolite transporter (DMT)-like permease
MRSTSFRPLAAGLGAAAIWGGMYAASKDALATIPPFCLLSLRLALGFAALAAIAAARGEWRQARGRWPAWLGVGFVGYGVSLGLQFVGTKLTSASHASLVTAATPALVVPFAALILGERPTLRSAAALALAFAGVALVIDPARLAVSPGAWGGDLLLVGAAATWALYSVLVSRYAREAPPVASTAVMVLAGLPASLALGGWELAAAPGLGALTPLVVGEVLFLGLVSTAGAMFLWNYAFARLPAVNASLTFFAQCVVGGFLGWLLLGESITAGFLAGAALIIGALVVPVLRKTTNT